MERLAAFAIKRKVTVIILTLTALVMGLVAFFTAKRELMPSMSFPAGFVFVRYPGASPEVIDKEIAVPVDNVLQTVEGRQFVATSSGDGVMQAQVMFDFDTTKDQVQERLNDAVQQLAGSLPEGASQPQVMLFNTNSIPIIQVGIQYDETVNLAALKSFVEDVVEPQLRAIPDVGNIEVRGLPQVEVRLTYDLDAMAALGVTPADLRLALQGMTNDLPAGSLKSAHSTRSLTLALQSRSLDDVANWIVTTTPSGVVRVRDLATIEQITDKNHYTLLNGQPYVSLMVTKEQGGNDIELGNLVERQLSRLERLGPKGVHLSALFNMSRFSSNAFNGMNWGFVYSALFCALVMFWFLGSWRTTLVTVVAIPTSIIFTFWVLKQGGFTLNYMSMMALALSMGMVVDATIVVMENIQLHVNSGDDRTKAVLTAVAEVGPSVVAGGFTTLAVFVPLAMLGGLFSSIMRPFGMAIVSCIALSLVVSFTLTPMLCSRWLRPARENRFLHALQAPERALTRGYRWLLGVALRHRLLTLLIAAASVGFSLWVAPRLNTNGSVMVDDGTVSVFVNMSQNTPSDKVITYLEQMRSKLTDVPDVDFVQTYARQGSGQLQVTLKDSFYEPERIATEQAANLVRGALAGFKDADVYVNGGATASAGSAGLRLTLQGKNYEELQTFAGELMKLYRQKGTGLLNVRLDSSENVQTKVNVDRTELRRLGISETAVWQNLQALFGEPTLATLAQAGGTIEVKGHTAPNQAGTLETLNRVKLRSASGAMVPLSALVTLTEEPAPSGLYRYNSKVSLTVLADPDLTQVTGAEAWNKALAIFNTIAPADGSVALNDGSGNQSFAEMMVEFLWALLAAVALVYVVMAIQFESFGKPLMIMFSVPLMASGALGALWLTGMTLDPFSFIGIIMLVGIVVNNAIILVDFADQARARGVTPREAMLQVGPRRLRPILMTTLSTMAGALPVALKMSYGDEIRQSMSVAVIGGLLTSTLLTLFVIPVLYSLFGGLHDKIVARRRLKALRRVERKA